MRHNTTACLLALSALLGLGIVLVPQLGAQTTLGDITGLVVDASGGAVPNAKVTLTNEGTQAKRTATTDTTGMYRIDGLLVGTYSIEVEAPGFKKYLQTGIAVAPATLKRVDVSLQVGSLAEAVEVHDTAPVIQSESATLTSGVPKAAYSEMPLANNTRAGYTFDMLVWAPGSAAGNALYTYAGIRGGFQQNNLEGLQHDQFTLRMTTSAISEVSLVESNAPAEYARAVTADATFKSGTNRLSGELMADLKNPCTDARSTPFSNPPHPKCKPSWRLYYSVGGPIYLPKIYNGKNKSFFFFTLNKNPANWVRGYPITQSIPTLAMQAGDFSKYPKPIIDPLTGQQFPDNVIPAGHIGQFAKGVIGDHYGSNYKYVGSPDSFTNNGLAAADFGGSGKSYAMKFDHNLGSSDIIAVTYGELDGIGGQNNIPSGYLNTYYGANYVYRLLSLAETHSFSPTVVNQLRAGVTRTKLLTFGSDPSFTKPVLGADVVARYGLSGIIPSKLAGGPTVSITNWQYLWPVNQSDNYDTRHQFYDNVSFHRGRHDIKTGYSATKLLDDGTATGDYFGAFSFEGKFTGEPWADFLLGLPSTFNRFVPRPTVARRRWEHGAFLQDDFKVTSGLTLSYGLRWSKFTVPYDKNGLYYNFDPKTFSVVVPDDHARQNVNPAWPSQTFPIRLARDVGLPNKLLNGHSNWNPRLGFAYKLWRNAVLRGGWGVYTGAVRFGELQVTGPFTMTETFINEVLPGSPTGTKYAMPNPFPQGAQTATVASISGFSANYRTPYAQNWNLTLEKEFIRNWGVSATYRGVKSTQLLWTRDLNEVRTGTEPFSQSRRPFPSLQNINFTENGANDHYHAMVLQVTHPWTNGIHFTAAYTYARSGTEAQGDQGEEDQYPGSVEYAFDRARGAGPNRAFPTHDFISNFVVEVPVGGGKRFASHLNPVLNRLIGNWEFSGAFSWRSGWFFTPSLNGVDPGNIGKTSGRRPDLVPGCDPYAGGRNVHGTWFNPNCYAVPAPGQLGNAPVNSLAGPGAWVLTLNPYKEVPLSFIREGMKLRVGAMIYNILNHPTYNTPSSSLSSATVGRITSLQYARGNYHEFVFMRQFLFDMRLIF